MESRVFSEYTDSSSHLRIVIVVPVAGAIATDRGFVARTAELDFVGQGEDLHAALEDLARNAARTVASTLPTITPPDGTRTRPEPEPGDPHRTVLAALATFLQTTSHPTRAAYRTWRTTHATAPTTKKIETLFGSWSAALRAVHEHHHTPTPPRPVPHLTPITRDPQRWLRTTRADHQLTRTLTPTDTGWETRFAGCTWTIPDQHIHDPTEGHLIGDATHATVPDGLTITALEWFAAALAANGPEPFHPTHLETNRVLAAIIRGAAVQTLLQAPEPPHAKGPARDCWFLVREGRTETGQPPARSGRPVTDAQAVAVLNLYRDTITRIGQRTRFELPPLTDRNGQPEQSVAVVGDPSPVR